MRPDGRLATLSTLAAAYARARRTFDALDIGDDSYGDALTAYETARETWEDEVERLGAEETIDAVAILVLELMPLVDEVRKLRRETSVPTKSTAALAPADALDTANAMRRILTDLMWRYQHVYPSAYEPARHGGTTGGGRRFNDDGTPASGANQAGATTEVVRRQVEYVSRLVLRAYTLLVRAERAEGRLEEWLDAQVPVRADWSSERQRERAVGRGQLIALTRQSLHKLEEEDLRDRDRERAQEAAQARKVSGAEPNYGKVVLQVPRARSVGQLAMAVEERGSHYLLAVRCPEEWETVADRVALRRRGRGRLTDDTAQPFRKALRARFGREDLTVSVVFEGVVGGA